MEKFRSGIRDGKKSDPVSGINIPDPVTLLADFVFEAFWPFLCIRKVQSCPEKKGKMVADPSSKYIDEM